MPLSSKAKFVISLVKPDNYLQTLNLLAIIFLGRLLYKLIVIYKSYICNFIFLLVSRGDTGWVRKININDLIHPIEFGNKSIVYYIQYHLPGFDKFMHPLLLGDLVNYSTVYHLTSQLIQNYKIANIWGYISYQLW